MAPAVGDIDNDGQKEIIIGCSDYKIYCLNGVNGKLKWSFSTYGMVQSCPALRDVDNDGEFEVVFGSDDTFVYCIDGNGELEWKFSTGAPLSINSPALGDIDGDGQIDIVIGSGSTLYCLDGSSGQQKWTFEHSGGTSYSPVLGDVDNDGLIEVVFGTSSGNIYCLNGPNGAQEWIFSGDGGKVITTPALGDVDNDTQIEIIIGGDHKKLYCIDGKSGNQEWVFSVNGKIRSNPTLFDVDNDERMEILFYSDDGAFHCLIGKGNPYSQPPPWPCYGGSPLHGSNSFDGNENGIPDKLEGAFNHFWYHIPIIYFEISDYYLNTTIPLETDLGLEINCTVSEDINISWVYLCENSTGIFVNRSMYLSTHGNWSYILDISGLHRGDTLMFLFYANDSYNNIGYLDNGGSNFVVLIRNGGEIEIDFGITVIIILISIIIIGSAGFFFAKKHYNWRLGRKFIEKNQKIKKFFTDKIGKRKIKSNITKDRFETLSKTSIKFQDTRAKYKAFVENVELKRGVDLVGGYIRYKVAIKNNTKLAINSLEISLRMAALHVRVIDIKPRVYRMGDRAIISNMGPEQSESIDFYLEPLICGSIPISPVAIYIDAFGETHMAKREPLNVVSKCPLIINPSKVNVAKVRNIYESQDFIRSFRSFELEHDPERTFDLLGEAIGVWAGKSVSEPIYESQEPFKAESYYYILNQNPDAELGYRERIIIKINVDEESNVATLNIGAEKNPTVNGVLTHIWHLANTRFGEVFGYEFKALHCPECGASFESLDKGKNIIKCKYCGETFEKRALKKFF